MIEQSVTHDPVLRVRDVVSALEKRGRHDEAHYYSVIYPFIVAFVYGVSDEEVMNMPVDDLVELSTLPQKPSKYEGWNTFHFGRAAFDNNS